MPTVAPEPRSSRTALHVIQRVFSLGYVLISAMFVGSAIALLGFAAFHLWEGLQLLSDRPATERLHDVLESIALLTVAVASLELGQTILEEEVLREEHMAAPTRVRRFLSRFMIVLVVALSIESLVMVFRYGHLSPENLPYAASIGAVAAALLVAWGMFVHLNRSAEELEPEAMERAKREDEKVR